MRRDKMCFTAMSRTENDWFMEQVRREQSRLRAYIRSLGVRSEAVDDLAQEALVIAHAKLAEFDRALDFGAWVRGIARKLVANARRKEIRRHLLLSEHLADVLVTTEHAHPILNSDDDRAGALRACLEALPEHHRSMLQWRYFEDLSPGAIASRLDRTANDVRQILFRLRRSLLECVEGRLSRGAS